MAGYVSAGIPKERLGIIFPWFGCDFVCNSTNSCVGVMANPRPERIVPPVDPGDTEQGCGHGLDAGPGIGQVMQLLPNATGPPVIAAGVYTKHFAWRNATGGLHEVVSRR